MEKHYSKEIIFPTYLFQFQNKNLAKKLKNYIVGLDKIDGIVSDISPTTKTNLVESQFDFLTKEDETIVESRSFFAQSIKEVLNDLQNSNSNYKVRFNESWYHIGKKNSSHDIHMHPNCSWCGLFYIQSGDKDGKGETKFNSPINFSYVDNGTTHLKEETVIVKPEDGKLIIFPSYLYHYQSLYTGNQDRIVVAFNSSIMGSSPA